MAHPGHFGILAIAFVAGGCGVLAAAQGPSRLADLETRVERIESVRAIKRLQYAYGHYTEFGLWNDFADLFTDDAVTNYQSGVVGKDAIRKLFFEQVGQGKLGLADGRIYPHILFEPVITLAPDGQTAKGRWRILAMLGGFGGTATWYSGVYENEYRREAGVWKISVIHSEPKVTAAYTAAGWKDSGTHVPFHFSAASVGAPVAVGAGAKGGGQVERRVARLIDQADVTNLLDTYGYAFEGKRWDQVADLFARDGTLELGLQGVYAGKASIRHALDQFRSMGDHVYLQTIVSVAPDGRTANARGTELIMSSAADGGELSEGVFENTFVRQEGRWKIQSVHFYPRMIVDATAGWAKSAKPAPGPSREFPPDRGPTTAYEIYPKFAVAPFHFDNPVTGKPSAYSAGSSGTAAIAKVEQAIARAEAYDAAEALIGAYSYYLDESPGDVAALFARGSRVAARDLAPEGKTFVNQILQPVIEVAPDGRSAKVQARLLDLSGFSGGAGYWAAGSLQGGLIFEQGRWRLQTARTALRWSARYPGDWARSIGKP
jgi:ketosteroid isomerase-like protein